MRISEERPWGNYEVYGAEDGVLTKRIEVYSKKRISLQKHLRRAEKWIIVSGEGLATVGRDTFQIKAGSFVDIPLGEIHRIHNTGHNSLIFMEIQLGDLLSEEDIVRFEDDFGRVSLTEPEYVPR